MIQSRAALLARILANPLRTRFANTPSHVTSRSSGGGYNYRAGPVYNDYPARVKYGAFAVGGFMWWWVLWHLWHEPEHITGEFPEPDPKLWTDKELGIPPDDYDEDV